MIMADVDPAPASPDAPPHRAAVSNAVLLASLLLVGVVLWPLWQPLLFAAILATVLAPVQARLRRLLFGRRYPAAVLMTVAVVLLILAPLTVVGIIAVRQAIDTVGWVRGALDRGGVHELIRPLPDHLERWLQGVVERMPRQLKALPPPVEAGRWAALQLQSVVATVSAFAFDLGIMLVALFFLLADGGRLVDWIKRVSPLGPARTQELLGEFKLVSRSVIGANFITGLLQASVATLGYWLSHIPQPLFFGLLTLLTSFIPSVGTAIVSMPLAALLLLLGHPLAALFLAAWSVLFVGTVDNLVRPLLIRGDLDVHGAIVFFSILGGIATMGLAGLVVGPLSLALFLTMLRFYRRDVRHSVAVNGGGARPTGSDLRVPSRPQ
jgi:predicted PurR-regulated permease PerM